MKNIMTRRQTKQSRRIFNAWLERLLEDVQVQKPRVKEVLTELLGKPYRCPSLLDERVPKVLPAPTHPLGNRKARLAATAKSKRRERKMERSLQRLRPGQKVAFIQHTEDGILREDWTRHFSGEITKREESRG